MKMFLALLALRLIVLMVPCAMARGQTRACGLLSDAEYQIMLKVTSNGTYNVPVAERTPLERSTLRRYYRYREYYSVDNKRLYYKGKEILSEPKCNKEIVKSYHKSKGIGSRRLYQLLKRRYAGISETKVKCVLSKQPDYQKKNARFTNKAPLKHVSSNSVHDVLQIDLVDMQRQTVTYKNEKCKFILSVMDIFSRFVWLRAVPCKSAKVISKHLALIFGEFGKPNVIQHDRGREFDGNVKRLLNKMDIKNVRSRPYHPQSQGKIERMHKTLKQKIAYDLNHANRCGVNWARQLPEYQRILNNDPKECLAWNTPYEIYYGRDPYNKDSPLNPKLKAKKLRDSAKAATIKCNKRNDRAYERSCQTPVYKIGDTVLLRYKKHGLLNRRTWVLDGIIQKRSLKTNMYELKYYIPDSVCAGEKRSETKWYHISDIAQYTAASDSRKKKNHRNKFYIPLTKTAQLINLRSEFGLPITMDPVGNGNCQFAAVAYQLRQFGIHRSEETLRQDVISFLRQTSALGNNFHYDYWWNSVLEDRHTYLSRMSREFEFGDQITLQAISQMYNMQIIVVSTTNSATTLIRPDGSSILSNYLPMIILGHYPEGAGEHYVALGHDPHVLERIIERSTQIVWESRSPNIDDTRLPNIDDTRIPNIDDTRIPNIDDTTIPNIDDTRNSNIDDTRIPNIDDTRSPNIDDTRIPNIDDTRSPNIDDTTIPNIDDTRSPNIDDTTISNIDDTRIPNIDDTRRPNIDDTGIPNIDDTRIPNIDDTRSPNIDDTGIPNIDDTRSPNIDDTKIPNIDDTRSPNIDDTRIPNIDDTRSPNIDDTRSPNIDDTRIPNIDDTRSPNIDDTRIPNIDDTRNSNIDDTRNPNIDNTRIPNIDDTRSPNIDDTRSPNIDDTRIPNIDDTRSPNIDDTTIPNIDDTRSPNIDDTRRPNIDDTSSKTSYYASYTNNIDGCDSVSSDHYTRIKQLRDMVEIKRNPKLHAQHLHVELPAEIWFIIVNLVLTQNPASRYYLQRVNRLFKNIVSNTPTPQLYLSPDRFRDVLVSPISVRKIIRIAGRGSGLVQAIRNVITTSSWANAWLFLRIVTLCGWYTIERIWYRRHKK